MNNNKSIPIDLKRSVVVALIGRTAAGKSTLINTMVGEELCITSTRTQTTRQLIRAITSYKDCQIILTDTPGYQERPKNALNRTMNRSLSNALAEPDVVIWVMDTTLYIKAPANENRLIEKLFAQYANPNKASDSINPNIKTVLVFNKIDRLSSPNKTLKLISEFSERFPNTELIPLSAKNGKNIDSLVEVLYRYSTDNPPIFAEDDISDLSEEFFAAEFLRESLYAELYQELPFSCAVTVDEFGDAPPKITEKTDLEKHKKRTPMLHVALSIRISNDKHKPIILGENGTRLKRIATTARKKMESFFGRKVYLKTWIKINQNWQDNPKLLQEFGYK